MTNVIRPEDNLLYTLFYAGIDVGGLQPREMRFDIITFCPIYFESDSTNRSGKVTEEIGVRGKIVSLDNHIDDMEISKAI